jgi:hypothetical protein
MGSPLTVSRWKGDCGLISGEGWVALHRPCVGGEPSKSRLGDSFQSCFHRHRVGGEARPVEGALVLTEVAASLVSTDTGSVERRASGLTDSSQSRLHLVVKTSLIASLTSIQSGG